VPGNKTLVATSTGTSLKSPNGDANKACRSTTSHVTIYTELASLCGRFNLCRRGRCHPTNRLSRRLADRDHVTACRKNIKTPTADDEVGVCILRKVEDELSIDDICKGK
jgi:hypothetical protein